MGVKLVAYFDVVKQEKGLPGQIRLAMLTKMSSITASAAEDSLANIQKFEAAIAKIREERLE